EARSCRHSVRISGPPRWWIAPSTPPPPKSEVLAALTIASTRCSVMSPLMIEIAMSALKHVITVCAGTCPMCCEDPGGAARPRCRAAALRPASRPVSPAVVDLWADEFVVDRGHFGMDLLGQWSEAGRRRVRLGLGGVASARDDRRDAGPVENPTQR